MLVSTLHADNHLNEAFNGSKHLQFLVQKDLLKPTLSLELEALYSDTRTRGNSPKEKHSSGMADNVEESDDQILLELSDAKRLLPISGSSELVLETERAILQVSEQQQKAAHQKQS